MNTTEEKKSGQEGGRQMRITDEEIELIQRTFAGNDRLVRLMRKLFLPEIDPNAPIGQMVDLWMTVDIRDMSPEEAFLNIKARNQLITHVDQQLMTIQVIANMEPEDVGKLKEKAVKDSNK